MKFCSILPIKNTNIMLKQNYVMLLAHLSQKYPDYCKKSYSYKGYKIMDNSIIELGESFTMNDLIKEAIKCDVDEIILPDSFENGKETVELVKKSIQWLKNNNLLTRFKLMAVCHGKNDDELLQTFNELNQIEEIDVIGLPKVLSTWCGSRIYKAKYFSALTTKKIHLLGCWDNLAEYKENDLSFIRSTDTCLPALLSIYGMNCWDKRNGLKIDLEKDEINLDKYNKIIKELYENCSI